MKLYTVLLHDGREEEVVADDYQEIDEEYRFFANGEVISDIFFRKDSVDGINVISHDYERDMRPRRGGAY